MAKGRINSILGGSGIQISRGGLEGKLDAAVEHTLSTSFDPGCTVIPSDGSCLVPPSSFTQGTLDSRVTFPTFGSQSFAFLGHALLTGRTTAPPQRFGYLGGSGTLATVDLLALAGDRLIYVQGDYMIPIERIQLPYVGGSPFLALRYAAGNAGVGKLPRLSRISAWELESASCGSTTASIRRGIVRRCRVARPLRSEFPSRSEQHESLLRICPVGILPSVTFASCRAKTGG